MFSELDVKLVTGYKVRFGAVDEELLSGRGGLVTIGEDVEVDEMGEERCVLLPASRRKLGREGLSWLVCPFGVLGSEAVARTLVVRDLAMFLPRKIGEDVSESDKRSYRTAGLEVENRENGAGLGEEF